MAKFSRLIKFESTEDGKDYFADLGTQVEDVPALGASIVGFSSFEQIGIKEHGREVKIGKVCRNPAMHIHHHPAHCSYDLNKAEA